MKALQDDVSSVYMDIEGMNIDNIVMRDSATDKWDGVPWNITRSKPNIGYALGINLTHPLKQD